MKKILKVIFSLLFLFAFISPIQAANSLDIVINEIAWMGTTSSANDEWIELFNPTDNIVSLDNWILKSVDDKLKINLKEQIPAKGFYLLERTDDTSVPDITANMIYTGALNNNGVDLQLFDNLENLIDEVNCSGGWIAGDNATKQTMEKTSTDWQTSENPGGTPMTQNSASITEENPVDQKIDIMNTTSDNQEPKLQKTYPVGIIFNEILPSPEGPDAEEEWIEIYNQNPFLVSLSGWKIEDSIGQINTFTFPEDYQITANGFLVLNRQITKITLNNDEDTLKLIQPDGVMVEQVSFKNASLGQSYSNTKDNNWLWTSVLTPGAENILPTPTEIELNQQSPSKPIDLTNQELASVSGQETTFKNYYLFFFALLIAFLAGILILKLDLKKKIK
ncbi:lamin tail domain-containing protein [Patescibacteria group bacterium]|nr:lamin tail domain-containing protein [Patescibacteria group bacterium]MBU1876812.1 lamin tail domain-containing protein [Patescibacteria group bacterium]